MTTPEAGQPSDNATEQAFNFGVMTDDQVMTLGRAIGLALDYVGNSYAGCNDADGLDKQFIGGMALLLAQDPDRAKEILRRGALSKDKYDQETAISCTPVLAAHDYELARDMLVHGVGYGYGNENYELVSMCSVGVREVITPSQADELKVAMDAARKYLPHQVTPRGLVI